MLAASLEVEHSPRSPEPGAQRHLKPVIGDPLYEALRFREVVFSSRSDGVVASIGAKSKCSGTDRAYQLLQHLNGLWAAGGINRFKRSELSRRNDWCHAVR